MKSLIDIPGPVMVFVTVSLNLYSWSDESLFRTPVVETAERVSRYTRQLSVPSVGLNFGNETTMFGEEVTRSVAVRTTESGIEPEEQVHWPFEGVENASDR